MVNIKQYTPTSSMASGVFYTTIVTATGWRTGTLKKKGGSGSKNRPFLAVSLMDRQTLED
jgi:hypothetical protein